jgi:capsular polysaccharide biosynthesis protein
VNAPRNGNIGVAAEEVAITGSGVRRFAGLPEGALPESEARNAGRRLASHPLLTARVDTGDEAMPEILRDAHYLLNGVGLHFDVLRTRPGCAVVRAVPDAGVSPVAACELVRGLLEAVTEIACGVRATILETTCAGRGSPACLYTLMWDQAGAGSAEGPLVPPPVAQSEPGSTPSQAVHARTAPAQTAPAQTVHAAAPAAAPLTAYRYLGQVAPAQPPPFAANAPTVPAPIPTVRPAETPRAAAPAAPPMAPSAPAPLVVSPPPPAAAPVTVAAPAVASVPEGSVARRAGRKAPTWVLRRSWLLVLALLAGTAGGFLAAAGSTTSYSATSTLVVQSGAGRAGPGSANDAQALATTYAALIPKDQAILQRVAADLHTSTSAVAQHLSVSVELGTSLLLVKYSAPSAAQAVTGSTLLARTVAGSAAPTPAIASGSVVIVQLPSAGIAGGALHKYGAPIGALFGLLLGIVLVLAAERADPRIDDTFTLGRAAGCPAASVPEDLSVPELARALTRSTGGATLTVVPLSGPDSGPTLALARRLLAALPATSAGSPVAVGPSFAAGAIELSRGSGPTILVLSGGRRLRDVCAAAERLRLMGRPPVWAVLVGKRTDQDASIHDQ